MNCALFFLRFSANWPSSSPCNMHEFERKSVRALEELLPSSNLLLYNGHTMHLLWTFGLSTISAILAALSILSSAIPTTSFSPTEYTANHELTPDVLPGQIHNLPVLPRTQSISKRSALVYTSWGNGWTSRSNTYARTPLRAPHSQAETLTIEPPRLPLSPSSLPPPGSPSSMAASSSSPTPSHPPCQPASQ